MRGHELVGLIAAFACSSACSIPPLLDPLDETCETLACGAVGENVAYYSTLDGPSDIANPIVGEPAANLALSAFQQAGKCGAALNATGANTALRIPEAPHMNYNTGAIWLWYRPNAAIADEERTIVSTSPYSSGGLRITRVEGSLTIQMRDAVAQNEVEAKVELAPWPGGEWRHLAVSWDLTGTAQLSATVDGCRAKILTAPDEHIDARTANDHELVVGAGSAGDFVGADGLIDEVQIYKHKTLPNGG